MAAVLDALAPYVKEMVVEELRMVLGASGEIEKLGDRVGMMEACLVDAERRRIDEPNVQRWVSKLKGALYDAIDMLDLCRLDAEKRRSSSGGEEGMEEKKAPGCLQPLLFCLRNPSFAHTMGKRMKDLNARLDAIHEEMARFRFEPISSSTVVVPPSNATAPSRTTTSLLDESGIVGEQIERDTNALVQELLADEPAIKVVSITGPGGMGKTTLASKIFNDKTIQVEFKKKIWLSVTETYDAAKLLRSAITQAGEEPRGDDQEVLARGLVDILSTGKFLLVMDDVWSNEPWVHVLQRPIDQAARNQPQSRVIITTRSRELLQHMGATYHQHHVKAINDEDAWSLLRKQLQNAVSESTLDRLKDIGMEIVRRCDGLPLAVKAVGGVLRMKTPNEREWKGVLHDPIWSVDKTDNDLSVALRLSYEDLSPPVKQCFLYYSLLPKGDNKSDVLIGMWISQGYIQVTAADQGQRTKEAEEIGICYYKDLITRNLIEPSNFTADGTHSSMHDVIRSFGRHMAKEEALVVQVSASEKGSQLASSTRFRHVSIESTESWLDAVVLPEWGSISRKQELLRSLIIKGRIQFGPSNNPSLSRFTSLRALFVAHAESERFVESLCKLKHLRFLHLEHTDISRLPDDIHKMKFLEYIGLRDCPNFTGQLPSSILKLERLRCLRIWGCTKFIVPKGLGGLTELNRITRFPVRIQDEWCSLEELAPLCKLKEIQIYGLAAVPLGSLAAQAKIHNKLQLQSLFLYCFASIGGVRLDMVTREDCQRVEEVFDQLCPPPHLETLSIYDYIGLVLPNWMRMTVAASPIGFNSLTIVDFVGLPFCTQLPDGLCQLPSLEHLYVDHAIAVKRVGPEFQGKTDSSSLVRPAFPRLQHLRFKILRKWEEWVWEEEEAEAKDIAMPALHTLVIIECKLARLPAGLASSRRLALRNLALYDLSRIAAVENFPSVVVLEVRSCPCLKAIRGFAKLQTVTIEYCPVLKVLEAGSALDTVNLADPAMETLPEYLRCLKPRILQVGLCHQKLRDLLSCSDDSSVDYLAEIYKIKDCKKLWCCDRWIVLHRQQLE
ncbi:hypothetical protein ACP70R_007933 [Stipagrostis hirtigluma subsp. patula]